MEQEPRQRTTQHWSAPLAAVAAWVVVIIAIWLAVTSLESSSPYNTAANHTAPPPAATLAPPTLTPFPTTTTVLTAPVPIPTSTVPPPAATTIPTTAPITGDNQEQLIVTMVNEIRTEAGLGPVTINPTLSNTALVHSIDMAANDLFDHTGSDGSTVSTRATAQGYLWGTIAENILYRWDLSAEGAFTQWFESPGHYANMMNPDVTEIGVAYVIAADGKHFYTMVLGRPR